MSIHLVCFILWAAGYFATVRAVARHDETLIPIVGLGYPMATFLPMILIAGWIDKLWSAP